MFKAIITLYRRPKRRVYKFVLIYLYYGLVSNRAMFSGAARATAKGFQGLLTEITPVARAATAGSARLLSKLSPAARSTFQAISKFIRPALVKGLKYSKNVGRQSVSVLQKKSPCF